VKMVELWVEMMVDLTVDWKVALLVFSLVG